MDVSNFIFRRETKDRIQEETESVVGEKRWKKLKELERNGELSKVKIRKEVVELMGYQPDNVTAYNWIAGLIRRGVLVENPVAGSFGEFTYYTNGSPRYQKSTTEKNNVKKPIPLLKKGGIQKGSHYITSASSERLDKLMELEKNGILQLCNNRTEVATALGLRRKSKEYKNFSVWFGKFVKIGYVKEDFSGKPHYSMNPKRINEIRRTTKVESVTSGTSTIAEKPSLEKVKQKEPIPNSPETDYPLAPVEMSLTITRGDCSIKIANPSPEILDKAIDKIMLLS